MGYGEHLDQGLVTYLPWHLCGKRAINNWLRIQWTHHTESPVYKKLICGGKGGGRYRLWHIGGWGLGFGFKVYPTLNPTLIPFKGCKVHTGRRPGAILGFGGRYRFRCSSFLGSHCRAAHGAKARKLTKQGYHTQFRYRRIVERIFLCCW